MSDRDDCLALMRRHMDVSRETCDRLDAYVALLEKWTVRINLVSRSSLSGIWTRHIADSAQVWTEAPHTFAQWTDLGSGGGLPAVVIAILATEQDLPGPVMVESDQRKSVFLQTVVRELGISAAVLNARIEDAPPQGADILSARALAPLVRLLEFADRHGGNAPLCLFPKGVSWAEELTAAQECWRFRSEAVPSWTNPGSVLLKISEIARA